MGCINIDGNDEIFTFNMYLNLKVKIKEQELAKQGLGCFFKFHISHVA